MFSSLQILLCVYGSKHILIADVATSEVYVQVQKVLWLNISVKYLIEVTKKFFSFERDIVNMLITIQVRCYNHTKVLIAIYLVQ